MTENKENGRKPYSEQLQTIESILETTGAAYTMLFPDLESKSDSEETETEEAETSQS